MQKIETPGGGGGGEESQNRTGQKCTAYELVRRQFFNTIKVWLMTFQCVLVIQSSLSLYPKLIDKKTQFWQN